MDFWLTGCDVFVAFVDRMGDPGPGWDTNNNQVYQVYDPRTGQYVRNSGDIIPTIIIKQVDP